MTGSIAAGRQEWTATATEGSYLDSQSGSRESTGGGGMFLKPLALAHDTPPPTRSHLNPS